jgi:hypothetical protein
MNREVVSSSLANGFVVKIQASMFMEVGLATSQKPVNKISVCALRTDFEAQNIHKRVTSTHPRTKQYPKSISQPRSVFVAGMAGARW